MTIKFVSRISLILLIIAGFSACRGGKSHFTVEGKIEGATDSTVYLFKRGITGAELVDSAKIGKDASFKIKAESPQYPDLYVVALGNRMINLAVDSLETIEITTDRNNFATAYQVKGSEQSDLIRKLYLKQIEVDKNLAQLKSRFDRKEIADSAYATRYREAVLTYRNMAQDIILHNLRDLSSYFALFQKIGEKDVFDPLKKEDSRLFAAVATAWDTYHKASPRAEHLKKFTLTNIAKLRAMEGKVPNLISEATTVDPGDYYNISLPGIDDKKLELKSLKGKIVLLDFTAYQAESSPAHNVALNKVFQKFKNSGFAIYQVSFNTSVHFWRTAASNLPWVCVREDDANSGLITRFNIQGLPTMFLLNKNGEPVKRIDIKDNLEAEIQKVL